MRACEKTTQGTFDVWLVLGILGDKIAKVSKKVRSLVFSRFLCTYTAIDENKNI